MPVQMTHTTYSFDDIDFTITLAGESHTMSGEGIGELSYDHLPTSSVQDVAADGSVMTSKILARNARFSFSTQQTSALHKFFISKFNILMAGNSQDWAAGSLTITDRVNGIKIAATNLAFEKQTSPNFTAEGGRVEWPFVAAFATMGYIG